MTRPRLLQVTVAWSLFTLDAALSVALFVAGCVVGDTSGS